MLGTASGLALACGINAYFPLLVLGLVARADRLTLQPGFDWLQSPAVLVLLALLGLADLVADKIPVMDHAWDVIHTAARPLAAVLCVAAVLDIRSDAARIVLVTAGAAVGGAVHSSKATMRLAASSGGGGLLTVPLSILEDVILALILILSFAAPAVTLGLTIVLLGLFIWFAPTLWHVTRLQLHVVRGVVRSLMGESGEEPLDISRQRSLFRAPNWAIKAASALTGPEEPLVSALQVTTQGIKAPRHAWLVATSKRLLIVGRTVSRRVTVNEVPVLYINVARLERGWLFTWLDLLDLDGAHIRLRFVDQQDALIDDIARMTLAGVPGDARTSAAASRPRARRI